MDEIDPVVLPPVTLPPVMFPPIVMLSWAKTGATVARPTTPATPNAATIAITTNNTFEFIDRGYRTLVYIISLIQNIDNIKDSSAYI